MNRITRTWTTLAEQNQKALIGYLTAGDPDPETSFHILLAACRAGLDILELGVPFSDPTADGPVIQAAAQRALQGGMTLPGVLRLAKRLRSEVDTPILLFGYYNPFLQYGLGKLAADTVEAGVDGLLIVDLPPEETEPLQQALRGTGLHQVLLVAPSTRPDRVREIASRTQGFLYLITKPGTTGEGGLDVEQIARHARQVKGLSPLPVCLGFGIRNAEDVRMLAPLADGVVVGSALVRVISEARDAPDLPARLAAKIRELRL
ncbi:MAG: tryptophan synthase subunit alpha [Verrucomicrobiota bacterium]|jgi:tryptophan synthase alpha chain|nr:tryptophan synthase subunit alpha [Verrucomicrobiota bacterium]